MHSIKYNVLLFFGCVIASMLNSCMVDRGFEPRSGQTKDCTVGISYFHAIHSIKEKEQNKYNVSEWGRSLLVHCYISELRVGIVQSGHH